MTMTRARAALLLVGLFLLGAGCGALATCALGQRGFHGRGPFGFRSPDRVQEAIVRRLTWRLDLDDAQKRTLEAAVARARADLDQIHGETFPRVEAVIERAFDEVAPALRPEQREKLERIRSRTHERLRRHRAPGSSDFP
jgi:hypothetical protein